MAFAYFFVFPVVFSFFAGYTPAGVHDDDRHREVPVVRATMFLAFGITFEMPVVVDRAGAHGRGEHREAASSIRPYVIVGAFVVGAVFTPPDVVSQLMLAVPMWLLYELGLVLARFVSSPRRRDDGARKRPSLAGVARDRFATAFTVAGLRPLARPVDVEV